MPHLHVSSSLNRDSIRAFGLDWSRMGAAPGIAGSHRPEVDGVFVCVEGRFEADWFVRMNNTGGPVDVWQVDGVERDELRDNGSGYFFVRRTIPPEHLSLVATDLPPADVD